MVGVTKTLKQTFTCLLRPLGCPLLAVLKNTQKDRKKKSECETVEKPNLLNCLLKLLLFFFFSGTDVYYK